MALIEYATPAPRALHGANLSGTLALPALISGLWSGPLGYAVGFLCVQNHLPDPAKVALFLTAFMFVLAVAFAFGLFVRMRLPNSASWIARTFATAGLLAPVGWATVITAFLAYAFTQGVL